MMTSPKIKALMDNLYLLRVALCSCGTLQVNPDPHDTLCHYKPIAEQEIADLIEKEKRS